VHREVHRVFGHGEADRDRARVGVAHGVRERLLRDAVDGELHVLVETRNRRREVRRHPRLGGGHPVDEGLETAVEPEVAELKRPQLARQESQVLHDLPDVPHHALELRRHLHRDRLDLPAKRLDENADPDELLADVVVEIEADALPFLLADRDLPPGEEPELLLAAAELDDRRANRLLGEVPLGDVLDLREEVERRAAGVSYEGRRHQHPECATVAMAVAPLRAIGRIGTRREP